MNRRRVIQLGAGAGALAAGWAGWYVLVPPRRSRSLESVDELAVRLVEAFDDEDRARACVPYEHPLRQYHNRGVRCGGLSIFGLGLARGVRGILTDLLHAGLSEEGRGRVPRQFFMRWPGVHLLSVLVCGDPRTPPYQIILSGPHLNLRLGGTSREGVAFGGPQVYGDQRGNERQGLPGNLYRFQFECALRLYRSLSEAQRRSALLAGEPIQTRIEPRGPGGDFPGVGVGTLAPPSRVLARELVDGILSNYPADDVAYAWRCLEENGGLEGLHLSYYEAGELEGSGEYQIFRLEGPGAVLHFKGAPHVHAFVNVAMDATNPLSVGALLGENPAVLESEGVKRLFEEAMRSEMGAELAYYDIEAAVGRLRTGPIREGDIYNLESWQDHVEVLEMRGSSLRPHFVAQLRARGIEPVPGRDYSVATTGDVASNHASERLGRVSARTPGASLRRTAIEYLRKNGFGERGG